MIDEQATDTGLRDGTMLVCEWAVVDGVVDGIGKIRKKGGVKVSGRVLCHGAQT